MNVIESLEKSHAMMAIIQRDPESETRPNRESDESATQNGQIRPPVVVKVTSRKRASSASSPTHKRAQELFQQAMRHSTTGDASSSSSPTESSSLSQQYLLLKRSLFLNPSSKQTYAQLINILHSHFLDCKEALVLARLAREMREDANLGMLDVGYYRRKEEEDGKARSAGGDTDEKNGIVENGRASKKENLSQLERNLFHVGSPKSVHLANFHGESPPGNVSSEPASPASPFAYMDEEKLLEEDIPSPSMVHPLATDWDNQSPRPTGHSPINSKKSTPKRSYLGDFLTTELGYIELLDEQSMRFVMEKKFEQAKFCLEDASKKLDSIDKEILASSRSPRGGSDSSMKHLPLAKLFSIQEEKKPQLLFESMSSEDFMMSVFSKHTLPFKEKTTISKKCRKLRSTLIIHYCAILIYMGQYHHADQCLVTLPENFVQARIMKAQLYLKYMKDLKKSKKELDYLWRNHKEVKNVSELRDQFRSTIKDKKLRGTQLLISKQYHEALKIFGETIEAFPADFHLYFKRAQCLRHLKLFPAAVKDLFECINLCGGSNEEAEQALGDSLYEMGLELMKLGTTPHLIRQTIHLSNDTHQSPEAYLRDAISYFSESLKWHNDYRYLLARGDCSVSLKQHENALKDYLRAKKMSNSAESVLRKIASLHNEWSKILFNEKKFDMAEEELTRSLEIFRENSTVYLNRAKVRFRLRKHADAVQDVVAAFLLDRSNEEAVHLVKQYVPAVLADPEYQERFRKKLFSMKESVQKLLSEKSAESSEVNNNRRLSRRSATTLIARVQRSQHVLARVPSNGSPKSLNSLDQGEDRGEEEHGGTDAASTPHKNASTLATDSSSTPSISSSRNPSRPTTAPTTTRDLPPKSPGRPQTAGPTRYNANMRRLSSTLTHTQKHSPRPNDSPLSPQRPLRPHTSSTKRTSNRDRLSLSRQLQYANAKLLRPLSANVSQGPRNANMRRTSAPRQSFAQHAHERFRSRKQQKLNPTTASPGVKKSARLSSVVQRNRSIVIGGVSTAESSEAAMDGNVHLFT